MSTPKVIKSLQHPLVKHLVKLRSNKRYRNQHRRLLVSSSTIINEIASRTPVHTLLITGDRPMYSGLTSGTIHHVSPEILKKVSGLSTPTDCVAEVDLPPPTDLTHCSRLLVLDRLADPGNVGTLARTALALGWDGLFLTDKTADLFNDKALRASRAALFKLPYHSGAPHTLLQHFEVFVADTEGIPVQAIAAPSKLALVLSSEAHGPDPSILNLGKRITIPMAGEMESLNVAIAGGILAFCLKPVKL